jgi:DNA-3-methyladenine glycosylase II
MRRAVTHLKTADQVLGELIQHVGPCRLAYREPNFAAMARAIVYQQLNGRAASAIYAKFEAGCGGEVTAEAILKIRPARLRTFGISPQKSEYLRDLAKKARTGEVEFAELPCLEDDEVIRRLTIVKGIGIWTAHMFLIFALRRPDVLPVGDYGVRLAMQKLYGLDQLPKPTEMERIATPWRPWRSVASWYLWRSLDTPILA